MRLNLHMVGTDRRLGLGKRVALWIRHHFDNAIKISTLSTLPLFAIGCSVPVESVQSLCEVRVYQQQVLLAVSNNATILKSGGVPSVAGNKSFLRQYLVDDLWLIQDYVRLKQWLPYSAPKTTNYEKIDLDTTFLIVGVDDPLTFKFEGGKYFDGAYSELGLEKTCPIFTGRRNGSFALATVRSLGGSETRVRCDIYATLAFFGISKEELENYSEFAEDDIFGVEYDRYAVRAHLETKKSCGGDFLKNLRLAADEGTAEAQYNLGGLYLSGKGGIVASDEVQAWKWVQLAANQGHAEAQALLGDMYAHKRGGDVEAAKLYRLAAKQGIKRAQYNLGQMYAEGEGIEQDYVQSHLWLSISETGSDRRLVNRIRSLEKLMTKEQIAEAKSLALRCVDSNYQDCE